MKNKKASHVSLVLSFSMFIIFLIFVYMLVSTSIVREDTKKYAIEQLTEDTLKQIKEDILVIRFYSEITDCVNVTMPNSAYTALVFDSSENLINSNLDGTTLSFDGTGGFTKIYFSPSLENPTTFNPLDCNDTISTPNSQIVEKKIIAPKIVSLIEQVSSNYDVLKISLNVASDYEFDISFEYENGTIIGGEKREPRIEIYSHETKAFYLSSQGLNKKGILRTKIW